MTYQNGKTIKLRALCLIKILEKKVFSDLQFLNILSEKWPFCKKMTNVKKCITPKAACRCEPKNLVLG